MADMRCVLWWLSRDVYCKDEDGWLFLIMVIVMEQNNARIALSWLVKNKDRCFFGVFNRTLNWDATLRIHFGADSCSWWLEAVYSSHRAVFRWVSSRLWPQDWVYLWVIWHCNRLSNFERKRPRADMAVNDWRQEAGSCFCLFEFTSGALQGDEGMEFGISNWQSPCSVSLHVVYIWEYSFRFGSKVTKNAKSLSVLENI